MGAEWIATRGARTRDAHAAADGQVRLIGQAFDVGGEPMEHPGDPNGQAKNVVNCRCAIALLTPEQYLESVERARPTLDTRSALLAVRLIPTGEFDELAFRRTLEGAA